MDFTSITVEDREAAKVARDRYMDAARRSRSAMDRALARSYAALAEGNALLDLNATMKQVGMDAETRLPKLAIVRADFMQAVPLEAAHQLKRWGVEHDDGKEPQDWFWLVGYLAGKCLRAAIDGDTEKAKHHTISTAAVMLNWHRRMTGDDATFRPGIERPAGGMQ